MAIVTGIEEKRGQVEILADGAVVLRVRKQHFDRVPVREGDEIDVERYVGRLAAVQFADAYEAALCCLDRSSRSEREIAAALRRRGYVEPAIEAVLQRLRENRLIDDARYAQRMAELHAGKATGVYAFKRKLRAKGISEEDAEEALSAFDEEQQRDACLEVAQSLFRRYAELPRREGRAKLSQALARRGFGWDVIESAVDQVFE